MNELNDFVYCPECAGEGFFWNSDDTLVIDKEYFLKGDEKPHARAVASLVDGFLGHAWDCTQVLCDFCEGDGIVWKFKESVNGETFSPQEKA